MKVFVTTGGTSEPIDDVRSVTNFSTGRFGVEIAAAFAASGDDVEVFASREAQLHADAAGLASTRFTSAESLGVLLDAAARVGDTTGAVSSVVVQLAAVSDYTPIRSEGKLSSDADEMVVRMRRNVKLIDSLRPSAGQRAFLVGAKLTSGAEPAETIARARELLRRARLNLVIANDLSECRDGQHPVWLVTAEGAAIRVLGSRADVAARIAAFVRRRALVSWSSTVVADTTEPAPAVAPAAVALMSRTLEFAASAGLLPSTDGNVVVRSGAALDGPADTVELLVTPRQVPKTNLTASDAVPVRAELPERVVTCWPPRPGLKSSIDTAVSARTFAARPSTVALLHTHELFGRCDATAEFPYPCGAAEEAYAMLGAINRAGVDAAEVCWSADLPHHGQVLSVDDTSLDRLTDEWMAVLAEYAAHLGEVGAVFDDDVRMVPVIDGVRVVGVVAHLGDGVAVFLGSAARGRGLGSAVAAQLRQRRLPVLTVDDCGVVDYWSTHGFTPRPLADGSWQLDPPAPLDGLAQLQR